MSQLAAPVRAFVALGANLGEPVRQIEAALKELAHLPDTRLIARSSLWRSQPEGFTAQPEFVNAAAALETRLAARGLLAALLDIERRHGRERHFRNAPRTLDLDILLYGECVLDEPGLHLPHPRLHRRPFVLLPLMEIAGGELIIPGHGNLVGLVQALAPHDVRRID